MSRFSYALAAIISIYLTAPTLSAQASDEELKGAPPVRMDTPSGLPVPRFVSFKSDRTNCRLGPSFDHPVVAVFLRAGAPVDVVAETTDHWRKVRDQDGLECWVHQSTLRAVTHVLVLREVEIRTQPEDAAPATARLAEGVLARLLRSKRAWSLVSTDGVRGWARSEHLWGVSRAAAVSPVLSSRN
ncbi:MAG: SH3 domain-containing protein [Parvularculaceae bacterium]